MKKGDSITAGTIDEHIDVGLIEFYRTAMKENASLFYTFAR